MSRSKKFIVDDFPFSWKDDLVTLSEKRRFAISFLLDSQLFLGGMK